MKLKTYLLALGLVTAVLPVAVQGVELLDEKGEGGSGGGPKARRRYIPPVILEIADGTISLSFMRDLGEVTIELQQTPDITVFSQTINAPAQHKESFIVPAGTYILTVTTADESILVEEGIVIP